MAALTASELCARWSSVSDDELSLDSINDYLRPVPDDLWVTSACVDRLVGDVAVQRNLLELGIERTKAAVVQTQLAINVGEDVLDDTEVEGSQARHSALVEHFRNMPALAQLCRMRAILVRRLDRLSTYVEICKEMPEKGEVAEVEEWTDDPWVDETTNLPSTITASIPPVALPSFLEDNLVQSACTFASQEWFPALSLLFRHHKPSLWPYRFAILRSIPEHVRPSSYRDILPAFDLSTNAEAPWPSSSWRPEPDWSETEVKAAIDASGVANEMISELETSPLPSPQITCLSSSELTTWYKDWVDRILSSTGMVDIALAAIQHGASQGVSELDELGEELSLLSRLVYDAPQPQDGNRDGDWTLNQWMSMEPASVVNAYLAHSTQESVAQDISRLVMPYLFVLESRAERSAKPDPSLHTRLLYDYVLKAPLELAAAIFEASKPTLSSSQRLIKNDEDIVRLALACLYGSDRLDAWPTMSRIFECLPAWDVSEDDGDEGEAADTTVSSLGAFVAPSTTRPRCTPSDLMVFFSPLPKASLSRALDILDVHLESGEILSRWGVPASPQWFLQSSNNAAEQRAWANRLARRANNSEDRLDTEDDWSWLLDDMLKLSGEGDSGLKGAFSLLSREEVIRIFFSGLLSTGKFNIAKSLLRQNDLSLDSEVVEDICLSCSREFYDNASSGNYKFGDMKLAYECLDVPPQSARVIKEKEFIEATSRLSSFNLMSRPGIPISPIEIRLTKDRLSLISRVLSSNADAYKHTEVILDLVHKLGFKGDTTAEVKVLAMLADTALQGEDFARAYEMTKCMVDTVIKIRSSVSTGTDDIKIQEASDACWIACFQLGRQPEFTDVQKKLTLLGQALEFCPPDRLHDILVAWRRLEKDDMVDRQEKLTRHRTKTSVKSSTKHGTSANHSLTARLQSFRMATSPLLKTPDAAEIASRTFRSVAANFPFSVTGSKDPDNRRRSEDGRRPDGVDVSAQASRVLSKGIGWLIGDDL